ncbi:insulin gene enhancer protein ISL-1-like isoform X2 [Varroa jacobsoni]|nr:insulin gene enhancer protein ISL-1-like isoform X2 [Varroa jacobsoni]XP_022694471.1 insulin gene enhancer protein ISL-1-like isoform X2 [Varroa jacobsoni]
MRARGKIFHIDCFRCIACSRQLIPGDEFAIREDELFCKADHDVLGVGGLVGVGVGVGIGLGAGLGGGGPGGLVGVVGVVGGATTGGAEMKQETPDQSPLPLSPAKGASQSAGGAQTPNGTANPNGGGSGGPNGSSTPVNSQLSSLSNDLASQYYSDDSTHGSSVVYSSVKSELTDAVQSVGGPRGGGGGVVVGSISSVGGPPSAGGGHGGAGGGGNNNGVVGAGGAVRSQGHKSGRNGGGEHKPTRVRTVLNEKQLHTLRTCYAANPRPDALMKEQLVEMTGLSPRVIRVWFQNKRCKDKKRSIMIKQMQQSEKDGRQLSLGALRGVPMVATSPVRHEPGQGPLGQALDIHSYQAPWKTLSDYAVNHPDSDFDPNSPQFRQLVNQMHGYDPSGPVAMSLDSSHTYLAGLDDSTCHLLPRSPSEMSSTTSD